jgi:hypothetical protein
VANAYMKMVQPYAIGSIHGPAGSESLVVLTAATLDNVEMVQDFIILFDIGSTIVV